MEKCYFPQPFYLMKPSGWLAHLGASCPWGKINRDTGKQFFRRVGMDRKDIIDILPIARFLFNL